MIPMTCRVCGETRFVERTPSCPPGTAAIEMICPPCNRADIIGEPVEFLDADGRVIEIIRAGDI